MTRPTPSLAALCALVFVVLAAPRDLPATSEVFLPPTTVGTGGSSAASLVPGAPHSLPPLGVSPVRSVSENADIGSGAPPSPAPDPPPVLVLPGGTSVQGIIGWASPRYGPRYLALPDGPGVLVRICGPAACLDRTSTDAGPSLAMQRAGRIADLNQTDWLTISGVALRYGLTVGTYTVIRRP